MSKSNLDLLETGDIILFHGYKSLFDKTVEFLTKTDYSHIGMVLKDPKFTKIPLVGLFFWESGLEEMPDAEDGKYKLGVQIVPFEDLYIKDLPESKLYWRKLNKKEKLDENKLKQIHEVVYNKPYDLNFIDWYDAWERKDSEPQKTNRFWCSALVGYIYTKLGILPPTTDWSKMWPSDFSQENYRLTMINEYSLGNQVEITKDWFVKYTK